MRYEITRFGRTFDRSSIVSQEGPVTLRILVEGQYGVTVAVGSMPPRTLMPWETYDIAISSEPIRVAPVISGVSSYIRTYKITRTICADKEVQFEDECDYLGRVISQDDLNDVIDLVDDMEVKVTKAVNANNLTIPCYGRPSITRTTVGTNVEGAYTLKKNGISDTDLLLDAVENNLYGAYGFGFIVMAGSKASMSLGGLTVTLDNSTVSPKLTASGAIKTVYNLSGGLEDIYASFSTSVGHEPLTWDLNSSNTPIGVFVVNQRITKGSSTSGVRIYTSLGDSFGTSTFSQRATLPDDYNVATFTWRSNDRVVDPVVYLQGNENVFNNTSDLAAAYFMNSEALRNIGGSADTKLYRLFDVPDNTRLVDITNGAWTGEITGASLKEKIGNSSGFGTDTVYMYSTASSPDFRIKNYNRSLAEINARIAALQSQIDSANSLITALQTNVDAANSAIDTLQSEMATATSEISELQEAMSSFSYDEASNTTRFYGNVAYGNTASATGQGSVAGGNNTQATGTGSIALGDSCIAENQGSIALGVNSKSTGGKASIAAGNGCIASGSSSVAVGWGCKALAANSFCGGGLSNSHTEYSFSWGGYLETYGSYSVNFGYKNTTNTFAGITSGTNNKSGSDDVSVYSVLNIGDNNTVLANQAFALGRYNTVSGAISGAIGSNLTTTRSNHLVLGNYNSDGDYFLSVGCGNSASNRQNAFTIDKNGNVYVKGNLTVDGTITSGGNILATGTIQSANDILAKTLKTNIGTIEGSNVSTK